MLKRCRLLLTCIGFGAAYGVVVGAIFGSAIFPAFASAGALLGAILGGLGGLVSGLVGGLVRGPAGWAIGGGLGGFLAAVPFAFLFGGPTLSMVPWMLLLLVAPAPIGALLGLGVGIGIRRGKSVLPGVRRLARRIEATENATPLPPRAPGSADLTPVAAPEGRGDEPSAV
jgi:hypothetical protein